MKQRQIKIILWLLISFSSSVNAQLFKPIYQGYPSQIQSMSLSADGRYLISLERVYESKFAKITLRDIRNGFSIISSKSFKSNSNLDWIALSADGKYSVVSGFDTVIVFNTNKWDVVKNNHNKAWSHGAVFSPNGKYLATVVADKKGSQCGKIQIEELNSKVVFSFDSMTIPLKVYH